MTDESSDILTNRDGRDLPPPGGEPRDQTRPGKADIIDVVDGPIGSAWLRDPSDIEAEGAGADLDAIPSLDELRTNQQTPPPGRQSGG